MGAQLARDERCRVGQQLVLGEGGDEHELDVGAVGARGLERAAPGVGGERGERAATGRGGVRGCRCVRRSTRARRRCARRSRRWSRGAAGAPPRRRRCRRRRALHRRCAGAGSISAVAMDSCTGRGGPGPNFRSSARCEATNARAAATGVRRGFQRGDEGATDDRWSAPAACTARTSAGVLTPKPAAIGTVVCGRSAAITGASSRRSGGPPPVRGLEARYRYAVALRAAASTVAGEEPA